MAYDRLDPQGKQRDDLGVGRICSAIAATAGVSSAPADYMHDYGGEHAQEKSPEVLWHMMKMFTIAKGGEVK